MKKLAYLMINRDSPTNKRSIAMKKKHYLVLSILAIITLLTTAAVCNFGQAQNSTGVLEEESQNSSAKKDSSDSANNSESTPESKTENSSSSDSGIKDEPKPEDNKSADENKPPVISGIYLDGLDPIDYYFFTNDTYTVRAEAIDPEGDSLTFKWSGDGTITGSDINPMTWTAPASEGVYNITVEASDDKGATSNFTSDIYVNAKTAVGDPPKGAEILNIEVISSDGKYYKNTEYRVEVTIADPLNEVKWYEYVVNGVGIAALTVNWTIFTTPDSEGNIDIRILIADKDGNYLNEKTRTIYIEP